MTGTVKHPYIVVSNLQVQADCPTLTGATAAARILSKDTPNICSVYRSKVNPESVVWHLASSWRGGRELGQDEPLAMAAGN